MAIIARTDSDTESDNISLRSVESESDDDEEVRHRGSGVRAVYGHTVEHIVSLYPVFMLMRRPLVQEKYINSSDSHTDPLIDVF